MSPHEPAQPMHPRAHRQGVAILGMLIVLMIGGFIVFGMVIGGAREQDLMLKRVETVRAFYAAEAGINMALRELMLTTDEDGDGFIGSVSDDGVDANNPGIGSASVYVSADPSQPEQLTLTSHGRCGEAQRTLEIVLGGGN